MRSKNIIINRLEEEKKSIIESFLKDYIYESDGEFIGNITEKEYSLN